LKTKILVFLTLFLFIVGCVTALERIDSSKLDFDDMTNFEKIDATNDIDFDSLKSTDLMSYYATISTKFGKMALEFYPEKAPNHVRNFLKLGSTDFYDGTTFHRVIKDFMIQGGDPNSKDDNPNNDGMGGPGYTIDAEFNDIKHTKGILSMARSQNPNSAGSQFFIMHGDSPWLDGKYTVFGKVVYGLDVIDKIASVETDNRDRPIENVEMDVDIWRLTKK